MRLPRPLRPLYAQVLVAIALAIAVGLIWPETGRAMKPLGDAFISLLTLMIGPIVFFTVVLGFAQIRDMSKLGRILLKSLIYFEVVSTLALALGMFAGNVFHLGVGVHASGTLSGTAASQVAGFQAGAARAGGAVEFFSALIPKTFLSPFATGDILQTLILSVLFGVATALVAEKSPRTIEFLTEIQRIFFRMLGFIMRVAPIGAFGAMAYTVGAHGGATLVSLLELVVLVYGTAAVFILVVLGGIAALYGFSILKILRLVRDEILLVFGTSSSEVVLPRLLEKLERAGCEKSVVGVVIPAGYSFNTDGTSIYMAMAVTFIAQATDTPISLGQQLMLLGILLLTSKGGAAVSGGGFVKLAATLQAVPSLPISGLGVLIGVDRFMSEARSITNMIGNTVATLVIAKSEHAFDAAKFHAFLANPTLDDEPTIDSIPAGGSHAGPIPSANETAYS